MANYDIPQYPTKRLRYFNNQFLSDQDFIDDDAAQIGHERAFLRSLCVAGVCEGLQVTYPAANLPPSVSAGIAIDKTGRMIVVDRATDALAKPDALADGDYFIHISFLESEDAKAVGQGASDFTRWKQTPAINATAKSAPLPEGVVVLGSCTVKNKAFVGSGTTIGRQYSGLRLPGPNQSAAATLQNSGASDDLAVLGGSLTIRRDARGQLGPTLTLLNRAAAPGAGGAIDFNGYDPGIDDPTLRIQSLDDGNSSSHLSFSTKQPGAGTNKLVERLRLTSDGALKLSKDSPNDKIVIYDNGATDRYGIGLNSSNINLFYPASARFSLRQSSASGNEVFSVKYDGTTTFTGPVNGSLTIRRDVSGQLGPTLTLLNSTGGTGAGGAIDFNGSDPGTNDPALRMRSLDDGNSSSHLTFSTKQSGPATNKLVERLRLTSNGLLQFPTDSKDKIVLSDNGTDRYGIGLNSSNINLFCPTSARFSLRQNSSTGTEVFSVSGSSAVTIRRDVSGQLGPTLTLFNGAGSAGAGGAIDFNGCDTGSNDPTLRVRSLDDGNFSSHLTFSTKKSGANTNTLVERLRLTSDGLLKFPNEAPKDKIVIWDSGTTDRFGMGLNDSNINLFYPQTARFSLRQNSSSGNEVFSVDNIGNTSVNCIYLRGPGATPNQGDNFTGIYYEGNTTGAVRFYAPILGDAYLKFRVGWVNGSDVALKTDIIAHELVLDRVMKLRPVRFKWKVNGSDGSGFIAQEVEALFPDLVHEGSVDEAAGRRMKGLLYDRFGVLAVAAIKELKTDHDARLDALERRLATLEGKS